MIAFLILINKIVNLSGEHYILFSVFPHTLLFQFNFACTMIKLPKTPSASACGSHSAFRITCKLVRNEKIACTKSTPRNTYARGACLL